MWTNLNVSLIRDQNGDPQYTLVLVEDISEQRQLRETLRHRASHDALTGLPNRAQFFDALTAAFADPHSRVGVCYIDLDRFKIINDTLGHSVGDQLLVAVAERLRGCVRSSEQLVARMGGDEFVVLVPQSTGADEVAGRRRGRVGRSGRTVRHRRTPAGGLGQYRCHRGTDGLHDGVGSDESR